MKSIKHIITLCLSLVMIFSLVVASGVTTASAVAGAGIQQTSFRSYGVDLSYWNVNTASGNDYSRVDFAKMKADGCQFAILRIGYEGSATGVDTMDSTFLEYYKRARAAGMPLGVYFYGLSTTKAGAVQDAQWVINVIESNNMYFEYPIYYDVEDENQLALGSSGMEALCLGWCETMEAAGYFPGVYGGGSQVIDKLSSPFKSKYDLWYPRYKSYDEDDQHSANAYDFSDYCGMWQHACYGDYDGVASSTLDLNVCYKDYPAIMKQYGYNNCESDGGMLEVQYPTATYITAANPASSSYKSGKYYQNFLKIPLTGDGRTDVLAIALSQLGYKEGASQSNMSGVVTSAGTNYTEYNYNMGDFGSGYSYDWCASFCAWSLLQSGATNQKSMSDWTRNHMGDSKYIWREVGCPSWADQLRETGYFRNSKYQGGNYIPQSGDLLFFSYDGYGESHIGIVVYSDGTNVYTVEGNTNDQAGLESQGNGVYFKSYSLGSSYIVGYGVLPYKTNSDFERIDYSGANPSTGIYISDREKSVYPSETSTTETAYMPRFTLFEVTAVASNGRLKVSYTDNGQTITGYVLNNSSRVIQIARTSKSSGNYTNVAYGKDYEAKTQGNYTANLTDGAAASTVTFDSNWFAFYSGSDATDVNAPNKVGTVVIDLDGSFDIDKVKINAARYDSAGVGVPNAVKVYLSNDGETWGEAHSLTVPTQTVDRATYTIQGTVKGKASFVKVEFTLGSKNYIFLNEIQVLRAEKDPAELTNVALKKDYTGADVSPAGSQYSADLTDGKASTAIAYDSNWFGFYYNESAVSANINAPDGVGEVVIDLEEVIDGIKNVKVHVWNHNASGIVAAKSITAQFSEDGETYGKTVKIPVPTTDAPAWATASVDNVSARYVKILIETQGTWTFLNEIQVLADPDYVPEQPGDPEVPDPDGVLGDVDDDGDVDASDYVLVKRAVLKTYELSEEQKLVADIDADGDVDATDYVLVKRIVLGTYTVE